MPLGQASFLRGSGEGTLGLQLLLSRLSGSWSYKKLTGPEIHTSLFLDACRQLGVQDQVLFYSSWGGVVKGIHSQKVLPKRLTNFSLH